MNLDDYQSEAKKLARYPIIDKEIPIYPALGLCGEAGEFANMAKKRKKGKDIPIKELGKELADIVMYCDLAAASLGISLEEYVIKKFNEVSKRHPKSHRRL